MHPTQITHGQHQRQQAVPQLFSARRATREHDQDALPAQLYQPIGPLKGEWEWRKKTLVLSPEAKRELIEPEPPPLSIARPCDLVG